MVPAILTDDKVVTGPNHGEAFGKLNETEKNGPLLSGFLDCKNHKFITDEDKVIYLKEIIILRHGEATPQEDGPLTELGRKQALQVANFLATMHLQNFQGLHSPYKRCKETSTIIEQNCHLPFSPCDNLSKRQDNETDFCDRLVKTLDSIPERSILITHTDFIQNVIQITHCISSIGKISNCSITYIRKNRIIWLAKEIQCTEESKLIPELK
jgi:phosphohistidine phosphatase SixA